ncbi:MAG TPA: matrixin family metalloprotease [Pyrinomonadaceae bacterium]|nr:matrixin family metalloprotease [Pyrinomonadaceae bacterium]
MQYPAAIIASVALFLALGAGERLETRDSSEIDPIAPQTVKRIHWPKRTIAIAFSNSLLSPGANIKPDSDVVGAARRALGRWSSLANINFIVTWSPTTSVSPADSGDGVNLVTIAVTPENEQFNSDSTTGRTRVFFNPETGAIVEADISINPRPRAEDGTALQFSTDGTPGTYDLEATFTHEIGHLLGLEHSAVLASTMQSRQAFNGTFGLPALTERTLSEDDRQKIRSLYGPGQQRLGRIEGRLIDNRTQGVLTPLSGVNVWAENAATGRVMASDVTAADGSYELEGLEPGQYRVMVAPAAGDNGAKFRSFEMSNQVVVKANNATPLNYNMVPSQAATLNPKLIGLNAELSSVALPLEPGKRVKLYLGGEGVDQVPGTSITINSPFFTIDPATLAREQMSTPFPVISVEVQVAPYVPFGDYTVRLQSNSGETAYVPGAITIDPAANAALSNPVDDFRFFINQQYLDLTGREADPVVLEKLSTQLTQCGGRVECLRSRRVDVSTAVLTENDLPGTGVFLHGLYTAGLGRRPKFAEFETDRTTLMSQSGEVERSRMAFILAFVQRSEFKRRYAPTMKASEFVDAVLLSLMQNSSVDLAVMRTELIALADEPTAGRAAVLARIIGQQSVIDAQYHHAFILSHYFGYLRRDPDDSGFATWLTFIRNKPLRDADTARSVTCGFLNSAEYQERFGMLATHDPRECK